MTIPTPPKGKARKGLSIGAVQEFSVTEAKLAAVLWLAENKPFNWYERIDEVFQCRGWEIYHWAMRHRVPLTHQLEKGDRDGYD